MQAFFEIQSRVLRTLTAVQNNTSHQVASQPRREGGSGCDTWYSAEQRPPEESFIVIPRQSEKEQSIQREQTAHIIKVRETSCELIQ
jgi:hypothetical protein